MRDRDTKPLLPTLVSQTFPMGHQFPYNDDDQQSVSATWYWAVLRYQKRGLDWYFDNESMQIATIKISRIQFILKTWHRVTEYIQWFVDREDYAATTSWDFNYLVSSHAINKYLGSTTEPEDTGWWKDYTKSMQDREFIIAKEIKERMAALDRAREADRDSAKAEYAAKLGVNPEAVLGPFEK